MGIQVKNCIMGMLLTFFTYLGAILCLFSDCHAHDNIKFICCSHFSSSPTYRNIQVVKTRVNTQGSTRQSMGDDSESQTYPTGATSEVSSVGADTIVRWNCNS